jgi:hypothetical protein
VGTHRIATAGDPFTSAMHSDESERLFGCDDCGRALPRKKLIDIDPDRRDDTRFFNGWRLCRACYRTGA